MMSGPRALRESVWWRDGTASVSLDRNNDVGWEDGGNECETHGGTMALMNGAGAKAEDEGLKSPCLDLEADIALRAATT